MTGQENSQRQNLILEDRNRLTVSGVEEVTAFDEDTIQMRTVRGELTVRGETLHIDLLSVETGELCVTGKIDELIYTEKTEAKSWRERWFS